MLYLVELPSALQTTTYSSWLMHEAANGLWLVLARCFCKVHEQAVLHALEALVQRCCNRPRCTSSAVKGVYWEEWVSDARWSLGREEGHSVHKLCTESADILF